MKFIRIISVILIAASFCCALISCNGGSGKMADLPERPFYDMTVSFQVKQSLRQLITTTRDMKIPPYSTLLQITYT